MDPEKVKAILDWPTPRYTFEVRSFHGLASFYGKFIRNFSGIFASIVETLKKENQPFYWTEASEKSFNLLKKKVTEKPVLKLLDFDHLFQVRCDASGMAIGVVLGQEDKSVAYFSEKLNEAKQKYSSYEKEFYAIIQSLKHWRHYLMPKEFILFSNNHALEFLMQQPKLSQKHVKWVEFL